MLRVLRRGGGGFDEPTCDGDLCVPPEAVWVDLVEPTRTEELAVERALGVQLPTREEAAAIEPSSRLYQEGGATFITAFVLVNSEGDQPDTVPVTFVVTAERLITIRYSTPRAFKLFSARAASQPGLCPSGVSTFLNLLDAIVDRTADVLERVSTDVDGISRAVFSRPAPKSFEPCLYQLGRAQTTNAEIRESLASLARATSFATLSPAIEGDRESRDHLRTINRDAQSLSEQSDALSSNIGFQLNAALGFINIQQTTNARVFSIIALVFLPPTLVASTYGMNFERMPELGWRYGYPFALGLMVVSAVGSLLLYHRKRWF